MSAVGKIKLVAAKLGPEEQYKLLPDGRAFYIGSTPTTAYYTPSGNNSPGSWVQGPAIPNNLGAPDAPGAMMVNGKILCELSPTPISGQHFPSPKYFYEFDYSAGANGTFTLIHAPDGSYSINAPTYTDRMLCLPDGTILYSDGSSQLYVYQPDGSPLAAAKPRIYGSSWNSDGTLHVTGTVFNGLGQGATYGDDAQMDSNYPLLRFTELATARVYNGRTFNWSSTSVQTGGRTVSTEAAMPSTVFAGPGTYLMQVVANGVASDPVYFYGPVWVNFNYPGPIYAGNYALPYNTIAQGVSAVASGGTIALNASSQPSASSAALTIAKPMTIVSVYGPSTIGH